MTTAKERPILFSGPMVRAILAGRKTQTRRVVKGKFAPDELIREASGQGYGWHWPNIAGCENVWRMTGAVGVARDAGYDVSIKCPYGVPRDRLWVRETWSPIPAMKPAGYFTDPKWRDRRAWYAADNDKPTWGGNWRPSIHMPRWASRITLRITGVRVERLNEISEEDAIAEGIEKSAFGNWKDYSLEAPCEDWLCPANSFMSLWESINGKGSWGVNPWVWVIEFEQVKE